MNATESTNNLCVESITKNTHVYSFLEMAQVIASILPKEMG